MGAHEHRKHASGEGAAIQCAVLTVSDTRSLDDDPSGDTIAAALAAAGYTRVTRKLVRDDEEDIRRLAASILEEAHVLITTGGTGVAPRDRTCEALAPLLDRALPGFGELFRMLSWQEVGAAAMLSRAMAGLHRDRVIFALPGSRKAVQLAVDRLIIPELEHLVWLARGTPKHH